MNQYEQYQVKEALVEWEASQAQNTMLQAPILKSPLNMSLCSTFARALTFQNVSCRRRPRACGSEEAIQRLWATNCGRLALEG